MRPQESRFLFVDLLRCAAVLFMIEGHVFDALLSPVIKAYPHYYLHDFFHGFVAPAFLFSSGVAYGVSTLKYWDEHVHPGPRVARRLKRFLGLIGIGYALHLPYFSLRKTIVEASPAEIQSLLQSDALQCIAVTLLLLQIGVLIARRKQVFVGAVAAAALAIIFSAPLVWSAHVADRLPAWLAPYLDADSGSWFPLIPWSAYLLCGVVFGYLFVTARETRGVAFMVRASVAGSLAVIGVAFMAAHLPFDLYPAHDFWRISPAMFGIRVGVISLVASALFLGERLIRNPPRLLLLLGRESLFIYIAHLLIVYGSVLNRGLAQRIGPTLNVVQALGIYVLVLGAVALVAVLWVDVKTRHASAARWIRIAGAAAFVGAFIVRPW